MKSTANSPDERHAQTTAEQEQVGFSGVFLLPFTEIQQNVEWQAASKATTSTLQATTSQVIAVKGNQWCQVEEWKSCKKNHHESRCKCWSSSSLLLSSSSSSSSSWTRSRFWDQAALAKANDKVGVQSHGLLLSCCCQVEVAHLQYGTNIWMHSKQKRLGATACCQSNLLPMLSQMHRTLLSRPMLLLINLELLRGRTKLCMKRRACMAFPGRNPTELVGCPWMTVQNEAQWAS